MHRLSPRQVQALAGCICGDAEEGPFDYRRMVDIEAFVRFTGAEVGEFRPGDLSRWSYAVAFIEAAQEAEEQGESGLGAGLEKVIRALLDIREFGDEDRSLIREFDDEDRRDEALLMVNGILRGIPVEARVASDGSVQVVSTVQTRSQRVLDRQIHTVFGAVLAEGDLDAAKMHYAKARRHLEAADPDYANAAKEAVSSVESLVKALTGEDDYGRAIRRATDEGLIPRPIDELAIKLYAYRGNEPGVGHGSPEMPDVTADEAQLVLNLSGALGAYLASRLRRDQTGD